MTGFPRASDKETTYKSMSAFNTTKRNAEQEANPINNNTEQSRELKGIMVEKKEEPTSGRMRHGKRCVQVPFGICFCGREGIPSMFADLVKQHSSTCSVLGNLVIFISLLSSEIVPFKTNRLDNETHTHSAGNEGMKPHTPCHDMPCGFLSGKSQTVHDSVIPCENAVGNGIHFCDTTERHTPKD